MRNELRKAQLDMYHLQKLVPPAMKGTEMMIALQQGTFTFDVYQQIDNIRKRVTEAEKAYKEGKRPGICFCKKNITYRLSYWRSDPESGNCDRK